MTVEFKGDNSLGEFKLIVPEDSGPIQVFKINFSYIDPPLPIPPGGFLHLKVPAGTVAVQWLENFAPIEKLSDVFPEGIRQFIRRTPLTEDDE